MLRVVGPLAYVVALIGVCYLTLIAEVKPAPTLAPQVFDHTYPADPVSVERPKVSGPPPSVALTNQVRRGRIGGFAALGRLLSPGTVRDLGRHRYLLTRPVGIEGNAAFAASNQSLRLASGAFLLVGDGGSVTLSHDVITGTGPAPASSTTSRRGFLVATQGGRLVLDHDRLIDLGHLGVHAYGVSFEKPAPGSAVTDSTIVGGYFGVYMTHAAGVRVAGNRISNSIVYGIDPHTGSSNLSIEDNVVTDSGVHGIILADRVTGSRVTGNTVSGAVDHGIVVFDHSDGNTITGNTVGGTFDGIVVQDSSRNSILANTVTPIQRFGLRITGASVDTKASGNTFGGAIVGAYVYGGPTGTLLNGNTFAGDRENVRIRRDTAGTVVQPVPRTSELAAGSSGGPVIPWWVPLSFLGLFVWGSWIVRQVLGARYRPSLAPYSDPASVIVPVFREDEHVLDRCIRSWLANDPAEVLLVIDHSEHELIPVANGWAESNSRIRVIVVDPPGKRHALAVGVRAATSPIVLLTDSDTMWEEGFLSKVLSGFADPSVGGVGCRQNVYRPGASLWRRVADWMLDVRFIHSLPAMARHNAIPCISGRTAAYRRAAILPLLDELEFETFLGRRCISGDDGRLTWLILRDGWGAGYQMNARAWTVFPNSFRGFVNQRIRWSRNSYRCYVRAIGNGWMFHQPVVTSVNVIQNLVGPFTLSIAVYFLLRAVVDHSWIVAGVAAAWLLAGRAIKGIGHLASEPEALLYVPLVSVIFVIVMIPVKLYSLLTLNRQGWITRLAEGGVAEGQGSDTIDPD